jgi:hypothetical protein
MVTSQISPLILQSLEHRVLPLPHVKESLLVYLIWFALLFNLSLRVKLTKSALCLETAKEGLGAVLGYILLIMDRKVPKEGVPTRLGQFAQVRFGGCQALTCCTPFV